VIFLYLYLLVMMFHRYWSVVREFVVILSKTAHQQHEKYHRQL
jgi:hypothetical protein